MSSNFDDDAERDAWLHEALRHAPDADTAPPPRVNDAILRLGRAAVAVRAAPSAQTTPSWWDRLGAAWGWLARPSVAAGFASLMVDCRRRDVVGTATRGNSGTAWGDACRCTRATAGDSASRGQSSAGRGQG